ncbi:MAG: fibronectin type III domain-containing protein, partial [Solimonas sp.]
MITRRTLIKATPALLLPPLFGVLHGCGGSGGSGGGDGGGPGGSCTPATPVAGTQPPRGLHVSWTDNPQTTRTLTWFTDGKDDPGSVVEYGPVEAGMSDCDIAQVAFPLRADGTSQATYGVEALTHSAKASGIDPARPIRYRVGSDKGGWSTVRVLQPAPTGKFSFGHFGDHAMSDASRAVLNGMRKAAPDFVLIAGDLSYANGEQAIWDQYFDMLDPLASRFPIMTCPG